MKAPTAELVIELWLDLMREGKRPSVAKVAKALYGEGYRSPRTRRGYTRQQVWLLLRSTARGQKLLADKKKWTKPK